MPKILSKSALVFAVGISCLTEPALAQQFPQLGQPQESAAAKLKKSKAKFKTTSLSGPMEFPQVPQYPASQGKIKFIRAHQYGGLGQGDRCYLQTFYLKEDPPETVREFYATQLAARGWMVQPANSGNTQILARRRREGSSCHVMVSKCPEKGYKTLVQLRYVQNQPLID